MSSAALANSSLPGVLGKLGLAPRGVAFQRSLSPLSSSESCVGEACDLRIIFSACGVGVCGWPGMLCIALPSGVLGMYNPFWMSLMILVSLANGDAACRKSDGSSLGAAGRSPGAGGLGLECVLL